MFGKSLLHRTLCIIGLIIAFGAGTWIGRVSLLKPPTVTVDLIRYFPEEARNFPMQPWLHDAQAFHVNDYLLLAPKHADNKNLWIFFGKKPKQISLDEYGIGIVLAMDQADAVSVSDDDHDGIYELLHYAYIDDTGNVRGSIIDVDRDGQPDIKTVFIKRDPLQLKIYAWLDNQWRQIIKKNNTPGVERDGTWKAVKKVRRRYVLAEQKHEWHDAK